MTINELIAEIERLDHAPISDDRVFDAQLIRARTLLPLCGRLLKAYAEWAHAIDNEGIDLGGFPDELAKILEARNDAPRPAKASDVTMDELEHISNCIHWIHVMEDNPNGSRCQKCAIVYDKILRKREQARNDA